jgi:hypothetical protein
MYVFGKLGLKTTTVGGVTVFRTPYRLPAGQPEEGGIRAVPDRGRGLP